MFTSPYFRRLFLPYLLLIGAATTAVGFFAAHALRTSYVAGQTRALRDQARLVSHAVGPLLSTPAELAPAVARVGKAINARVTVMRADGVVLADNEADPATMENHRDRPEFLAAARHGEGTIQRTSGTVHAPLLYLARPMLDLDGQPARAADAQPAYVRLAVHLDQLQHDLGLLYTGLAAAALVATAVAGLICYVFARRHTRPMLELTRFANALSRGDLRRRAVRPDKGEISTLASSLNTMADSLSHLIDQTNKDKAELLTILSSMAEGVIATDAHQRVLLVNDAAAKLLGFDRPDAAAAIGKQLFKVVRNDQIIRAAGEVLSGAQRKMISVGPVSARHLDVTLCPFPSTGPAHGLVIVAHDITQSFQYQELRKEFVANVSHELRTPLTVIKGFVETLQDGAWKDEKKAPEFLATIHRHTNQLTNLVSDLLELSRLESTGLSPRRGPVDLAHVIQKAVELLTPATQKKHQTLTTDVTPLPAFKGNADYLERAVANLIDNASKYTPDGGRIDVRARADDDHSIVIEVADNGIGIPNDDLPRIFERFYRVDRSRSREMGGTGLGLSIVKHVAQVHGGTVEVDSTPGSGSTFRLKLPTA